MSEEQPNKIDDYVLLSVIATGKSSQVWEVMHEQSGRTFAMKLLLPEAMADADEKALLRLEGKLAKQFEHPRLIQFHGIVMRKTECYLLLELFKTPNLNQWIKNERETVESLFRKLVEGICQGLGYMHEQGWVHKDIKPDNILVNRSGEVKLIDFSLAVRKASALSKLMASKKGVIRGTRTYLAPETIKKIPATPATDLYSLGCVLYECLTGHHVFTGESPQDLLKKHIAAKPTPISLHNDRVAPEMERLIMKLLAKKPKDRFQSCEELMAEFRNCRTFQGEARGEAAQEDAESQPVPDAAQNADDPAVGEQDGAPDPEEARLAELMELKRDSRADAQIREILARKPRLKEVFLQLKREQEEREEKERKVKEARLAKLKKSGALDTDGKDEKKKKKKKKAAPQQVAQPMPQQPMMPPPMQAMPPGYAPQMPPPGYGAPVPQTPYGMGMPQPGMPGAPPPGYPPQQMPPGMPPQPMPPGSPGYGVPPGAVPPPGMQAPPPAQPPETKPATMKQTQQSRKQPAPEETDLPTMTELPDIE